MEVLAQRVDGWAGAPKRLTAGSCARNSASAFAPTAVLHEHVATRREDHQIAVGFRLLARSIAGLRFADRQVSSRRVGSRTPRCLRRACPRTKHPLNSRWPIGHPTHLSNNRRPLGLPTPSRNRRPIGLTAPSHGRISANPGRWGRGGPWASDALVRTNLCEPLDLEHALAFMIACEPIERSFP